MLEHMGRSVARRRWLVVVTWVVVVVALGVLSAAHGGSTQDAFTIPGSESQAAIDLLDRELPAANDPSATVVFHAPDGKVTDAGAKKTIEGSISKLGDLPSATASDPLSDPLLAGNISKDEKTVYTSVSFSTPIGDLPGDVVDRITDATGVARDAGLEVALGGVVVDVYDAPTSSLSDHADDIGLLLALVILVISLRSAIAALMPIGTALFALGASTAIVSLLERVVTIGSIGPVIGTMLGLGVGIDYSLFIVSRFRRELDDGQEPSAAVGRALATSGSAVLFAAVTVCLAMVALSVMGIPYVRTLGLTAALFVAVTVLAALTLLPALLAILGHRVLSRGDTASSPTSSPTWSERWGRMVTSRPWPFALGGVAVLLVLIMPLTDLELGLPSDSSAPKGSTQREAYDRLTSAFGPGVNGPLLVVGGLRPEPRGDDKAALAQLEAFVGKISDADGVARVVPGSNPPDYSIVLVEVIPDSAPTAPETVELVSRLRDTVVPDAAAGTDIDTDRLYVGGATAEDIDLTDRIQSRLALQFAIVVGGSFLLLIAVFRSVLIPLKAAVLNLLSIGASLGVLVAVFEWGWLRDAIALQEVVVIASFVPVMMFAILFGLSMDYEVFLMSRIREAHVAGTAPRESVVVGISQTSRVITSAAAIMIAVFLSFLTNPAVTVKMMGLGMAVAVLIDALIARMVLVPSVMSILGARAWWLPGWLDRHLPRISVDGPAPEPEDEDAPEGELVGV